MTRLGDWFMGRFYLPVGRWEREAPADEFVDVTLRLRRSSLDYLTATDRESYDRLRNGVGTMLVPVAGKYRIATPAGYLPNAGTPGWPPKPEEMMQ